MSSTENNEKSTTKSSKILLIILLAIPILGGFGVWYYFHYQGTTYLTTENARVHTTLFHITPPMTGTLERFTIREGQHVRKNELMGWIEHGESFRSPINGLVVRTFAEQNQTVWATEPIAVIADTADLHIQANVEEVYISRLQIGQAVTVTIDALGRQRFNGYIAEIGRVTDAALTGEMMAFTTTGRFTKVTQLLPVRINLIDDLDLSSFIGLNAGIRVRLRNSEIVRIPEVRHNQTNQIFARGTVESVEQRNIYSVLGHKIDRLFVEVGDTVSRGQTLATLDDGDLMPTLARQQAEINLRNTRTALETARIYHTSLSALYEAGGISQIELLQAENALSFAQSGYNDSQAQLRTARHNVGRQSVTSPIDGVVTARFVREGAIAAGLLFVVEDVDNFKIRTLLREYDITKIHVGMSVTIISDATGNEYEGKISRIFPTAMKNEIGETACFSVVNFEVEVAVVSENTDLRIGMSTRVRIEP